MAMGNRKEERLMTYPPQDEYKKISVWNTIVSWEFVIAIFATIVVYSILDKILLGIRYWLTTK